MPLAGLEPLEPLPPQTQVVERDVPAEALKRYLAGLALADRYQDTEAVEQFEAAVAADPQGFPPRLDLGRVALRAGQLDRAAEVLSEAADLRPRDPEVRYLLGVVAAGRGDTATALRELRYGLQLADDDGVRVRVYFHLAQVLQRRGYLLAAVEVAERFEALVRPGLDALPLRPEWRELIRSHDWRIPMLRGQCLRQLGRGAEAIEAYEAALAMSPERSEVLAPLAEALIDVGQTRRAAEVADQLLTREPTDTNALALLAATLAVDQRYDELRERLLALVRGRPGDLLLAQRVASVFVKFNRSDTALQALLIARNGVSDPAPVYASLMQIILAQGGLEDAVGHLGDLLGRMDAAEWDELLEPVDSLGISETLVQDVAARGRAVLAEVAGDESRLVALGVIAGAADRPVLAGEALRKALSLAPDRLLTAVLLGEQLLGRCQWDEAIAFATQQLEKHSDAAVLYRIRGEAYDGLDDYRTAMSNLYETLRRDRRDTRAMWLVGRINERIGQAEPAAGIYQVLVTVRPDAWPAQLALIRNLLALGQRDAAVKHAASLREVFPQAAATDLCGLMAEQNEVVPPSDRIEALLDRHPGAPLLLEALAEARLKEGEPAAAVGLVTGLLAGDPGSEQLRLLLTTGLTRQLKMDLALEVLESLLAEHPNRTMWRFARAELLGQAGRPAAAAEAVESLLDTPWGAQQKQMLLARLVFYLQAAGEHDRAIDRLEDQIEAQPGDRSSQILLLGVLEDHGQRERALALLRSWRRAEPADPLLKQLEVRVLSAMGREDAAAAEALRDWPGEVTADGAIGNKVLVPAAALPAAEARRWLAAQAWTEPAATVAGALAELAAGDGHYLQAIELGNLAGGGAQSLARQVQWAYLAGQWLRAELILRPRVKAKDQDLEAQLVRLASLFYRRLGLEDLSVEATEALYRQHENTAKAGDYANDLAYVWAERGQNLAAAEDLALKAVAGDPNSAAHMDTLGWVYYKQGRFDEALRWLLRAVSVPSEGRDPVLLDHLGDAYWRTGQQEEAMRMWLDARTLYREQLRDDPMRPDLRTGLDGVRARIRAVQEAEVPPVAPQAGQRDEK